MAIIAGFDPPSIRNLGYSLFRVNENKKTVRLKEAGLIQLKDNYEDEEYNYDFSVKTSKLEEFLKDFYEKNKIKEIAREQQILPTKGSRYYPPLIFVQTNLMSNVIEKLAYEKGIARHRIHNKTLKKQVCGSGSVGKQEVMDRMVELLKLELDYKIEDCTEKQYLSKYEHCFDSIMLVLAKYNNYKVLPYGKFKPINLLVEDNVK